MELEAAHLGNTELALGPDNRVRRSAARARSRSKPGIFTAFNKIV
jgi:hypothetical protein